jgi:hypothetical protein
MNVYIVRDAVEIGHFPRADLEQMARDNQLLPTDYYWHEGMENWALLPELLGADAWKPLSPTPAPAAPEAAPTSLSADTTPDAAPSRSRPRSASPISAFIRASAVALSRAFTQIKEWPAKIPRVAMAAAFAAALIVLVSIIVHLTSSKNREITPILLTSHSSAPNDTAHDLVSKRKAAEDLKEKINQLPSRATAPLYAFYYDFSFNMIPSSQTHVPWTATIHGGENIIDPGTEATIRRTEFVLIADYRNGEWTFKNYHALETDASNGATKEIIHDEKTPVPPNIVGILGLKRDNR